MTGRTFQKRGSKDSIQIESLKLACAKEVARDTKLFRVPDVIRAENGVLETAYIPDLVPFRRYVFRRNGRLRVAMKVGASLAAIHAQMQLPEQYRLSLPKEIQGDEVDGVFLHGDFSGVNVCVDEVDGIVVLDWSMTPRFGVQATFGTRYFDVSWFLCNLFRRPIYDYVALGQIEPVATAFLEGYGEFAGAAFSRESLADYHQQFFPFRMSNRSKQELFWPKRMLLSPGWRAWNSYVRSF